MNRFIAFNDEQINAEDICYSNLFPMIGIAKLAKAVLGSGPLLNDLTCVPTGPASLSVIVNAGEIYQLDEIDSSPYGALPADPSHQILKTGIMLDFQTIPLTPPVGAGDSINYLIQAIYSNTDINSENRPFFGGPPQVVPTIRSGNLVLNVKAGVPAPTGSQVTPTPDAGYTGAWVVTVANGQTQIISGDISPYNISNFIIGKLQDKISQSQADARYPLSTSFNNSISTNGYQKLPGGLTLQWGSALVPFTSGQLQANAPVTYPIPFPNNVFIVLSGGPDIGIPSSVFSTNVLSPTITGFDAWVSCNTVFGTSGNFTFLWFAIGH